MSNFLIFISLQVPEPNPRRAKSVDVTSAGILKHSSSHTSGQNGKQNPQQQNKRFLVVDEVDRPRKLSLKATIDTTNLPRITMRNFDSVESAYAEVEL